MEHNIKDVEKYILFGYVTKKKCQKNRSVEKNILYSGYWSCFWAVMTLVVFHIFAIFGDRPMRILPVNLSILLLIPIIILLAIKFSKSGLASSANNPSNKRVAPLVSVLGISGAAVGFVFARFFLSDILYSMENIIVTMITIFLVLLFIFIGCIDYYRVYLIRKFCPHLREKVC